MDDLIVNVKIWDRLVGALIWDKNKNVASFQFEPKFLRAGLDVSPIVMPLKKSSKDTVYQFLGNRNECFKGLPGLIADSLPDKYGNKIIDEWFAAHGLMGEEITPLDRLCYMTAPHRMDLMVSAMEKNGRWNCNQHCLHCYAAGQTYSNVQELGTADWKRVIEKCQKARIPQLTFTGGEPTMREDLFELLKEARWFITRLNTNGIKLTREYCEKLREAELDNVQITFYSQDAEIHNKLTGALQYDKTVEGIKNALEAGLSVNVNTPLCAWNADYVETVKFLKSLGVTYVTCSGLIPAGNAVTDDSQNTRLSKEEIQKAVADAASYCWEHGMELSFTSPGWIEEKDLREMGLEVPSCGAALSNMAVAPDGTVVACQSCLDRENFGNILTAKWKDIWEHPDCRKYREFSAQMKQECPLGKEENHG